MGSNLSSPVNCPDINASLLACGGVRALNTLRLAANVADTETVTIGSDVYEMDNNSTFTAGRIQVVLSGLTPAIAGPALAAAINANPNSLVNAASVASGARVLVWPRFPTQINSLTLAMTETLAGAGNAWDSTTVVSGGLLGNNTQHQMAIASRAPIAAEVTAGFLDFIFPFAPTIAFADIIVTATGVRKAWDGALTLDATNNRVQLDNAGATDWAATDTVRILAFA